MRLIMVVIFIWLLYYFGQVSAMSAGSNRWLIFETDKKTGKIAKKSHWIYTGKKPVPGQNVPLNVVVKALPDGIELKEAVLEGGRVTKEVTKEKPKPTPTKEEISLAEIPARIREKAYDNTVSDTAYMKLLRVNNIPDRQTRHQEWERLKKEYPALKE